MGVPKCGFLVGVGNGGMNANSLWVWGVGKKKKRTLLDLVRKAWGIIADQNSCTVGVMRAVFNHHGIRMLYTADATSGRLVPFRANPYPGTMFFG